MGPFNLCNSTKAKHARRPQGRFCPSTILGEHLSHLWLNTDFMGGPAHFVESSWGSFDDGPFEDSLVRINRAVRVRPGLEARTCAVFEAMGQLSETEFKAMQLISRRHQATFGICGSLAETRIGIARRVELRAVGPVRADLQRIPPWRNTGAPSNKDVDDWFAPGTAAITKAKIEADIQQLFPTRRISGADYQLHNATEHELARCGAIMFDNGKTRRYLAPWQTWQ